MRLSDATASTLPATIARPGYDPAAQRIGIIHLGLGAFTRAHQAVYTDDAMAAGDTDWAIAAASLRSTGVRDALAPQDGLYTVTERGPAGEHVRLIGAVRRVTVVADEGPEPLAALLVAPTTRIVTLTVTEKGYWRRPDGRFDTDGIAADGNTIYHHLARAVAARHAAGHAPLTLVSCDNLPDNGHILRAGLGAWLDHLGHAEASAWFDADWRCPNTMVDRIVPAVTAADRDRVAATLGLEDAGAVITEPFRQWVIEDDFPGPRPRWDAGGAQFVADVAPYETAKLRMLNGSHSALAYLGLARGHEFVHQAIADPAIRAVVEPLIRVEAPAGFTPAPGQDLAAYADAILARFANPALPHRLSQIACDGSQKIAARWLPSLRAHADKGTDAPATLAALSGWIRFTRTGHDGVTDPLAAKLQDLWRQHGSAGIVDALFGPAGIFADQWQPTPAQRAMLSVD